MKGIKVVLQDGYVKISYSNNSKRKRFPTGVRLDSDNQITDSGKLKGNIPDKEQKQNMIDDIKLQIESIVNQFRAKSGFNPSIEELEYLLRIPQKRNSKSQRVLDAFNDFYEEKKYEFSNSDKKVIQSLNSHRALMYYLGDYEVYLNRQILFSEIDRRWMFEFKKFNETPRVSSDLRIYKTFGGLRGNTIKKKISIFINFMKWASEKKYCDFPTSILNFSKEIESPEIRKATVTREEVLALHQIDIEKGNVQFIRDLFVFTCLTGMRWSDLMSLNKKHLKNFKQGTAIVMKSEKTKEKFTVFLNEISQSILEKYEYNLNRMSNPAYNRELKKFLKSTEMFNDSTDFIDDGRYLERWEVISIHRGRDSFITNLLNSNVPVSTVMQYTGHKQLRTLEGYVDTNTKVPNFIDKLL